MDRSGSVFSIQNLSKTFGSGVMTVQALREVNLELKSGELVVLLGPSGSGKSTLLNILGGLDNPTEGRVFYAGQALPFGDEEKLTDFRRRHVGFVFQFFNLIPNLTALENVQLAAELSEHSMKPLQALEMVGLKDRAHHFPSQLSGGEQQRVAIARAISKKPELLLCDEPTGALDIRTGKLVLEAIVKINKELGTLVVVITHNSAIAGIADRVIHLSDGRVADVRVNKTKIPVDEVHW